MRFITLALLLFTSLMISSKVLPSVALEFRSSSNVDSSTLVATDLRMHKVSSSIINVLPVGRGLIVFSDGLALMSNDKYVSLPLGSGEYVVSADYSVSSNIVVLMTNQGNLLAYDLNLNSLWEAHYSFPQEMRNITLIDVLGDDSSEIVVWGPSSGRLDILDKQGFYQFGLKLSDAVIIEGVYGVSINKSKYLVVIYYDSNSYHNLAIFSGNELEARFRVLSNYTGNVAVSVDLILLGDELIVGAVSKSEYGSVSLEYYNVSNISNPQLEEIRNIGVSKDWFRLGTHNDYLVVLTRSFIFVSNETYNVTLVPGDVLFGATGDSWILLIVIENGTQVEKYLELYTVLNGEINFVGARYLGTSSMVANIDLPLLTITYDGGSLVAVYNLTEEIATKFFPIKLEARASRYGLYLYNRHSVYRASNGHLEEIYTTKDQIVDIAIQNSLYVLERINYAYYRIVSINADHTEATFEIYDYEVKSFSEPIGDIFPVGITSPINGSSKILLVNTKNNTTSQISIPIVPSKIIRLLDAWVTYQALDTQIYLFNSEGFVATKFFENYLIYDCFAIENYLVITLVDTLENDYDIAILGEYLETIVTLDNTISSAPIFGGTPGIHVIRQEYGVVLTAVNLSNMSLTNFTIGKGNFVGLSVVYTPNPQNVLLLFEPYQLDILMYNETIESSQTLSIKTKFQSYVTGVINQTNIYLFGLNETGLYTANVSPILDSEYPIMQVRIFGENVYGNMFVCSADNVSFLVNVSDDYLIYALTVTTTFYVGNTTVLNRTYSYEEFNSSYKLYRFDPPPNSTKMVLKVTATDYAGHSLSLKYIIYIDWYPPKIKLLSPPNTTSGKIVFVVYDDVAVRFVYVTIGDKVLSLAPTQEEGLFGEPQTYIVDYSGGLMNIVAVDYVGHKSSLSVGSESKSNLLLGLTVGLAFIVGFALGFALKFFWRHIREISEKVAGSIRDAMGR